jgi:hypothetical protein
MPDRINHRQDEMFRQTQMQITCRITAIFRAIPATKSTSGKPNRLLQNRKSTKSTNSSRPRKRRVSVESPKNPGDSLMYRNLPMYGCIERGKWSPEASPRHGSFRCFRQRGVKVSAFDAALCFCTSERTVEFHDRRCDGRAKIVRTNPGIF